MIMRGSTDPRHVPVCEEVLGPHRPRPAADLQRNLGRGGVGAFEEFEERWATPCPAISALWRDAWEVRSTPVAAAPWLRVHFPSEQAALKTLYLVTRSLDPRAPARRDGHAVEVSAQRVRRHLR